MDHHCFQPCSPFRFLKSPKRTVFDVDEVIDPATTRARITHAFALLLSAPSKL
jgi:hypothetical protein